MARIKWMPRCARRSISAAGGAGVDRLSALPDDLLRLILRRLDTRTALSTAALARRWARLPRDLPALDLTVGDVLPRRYHRALAALRRHRPSSASASAAAVLELDALVARCERRAMRAFADGVAGLLLTDKSEADGGGDDHRRRAKSLRLEFFPTEDSACVDRLIPTAVAAWGVEDLELVARPPHLDLSDSDDADEPAYAFPHHLLDDDLHRARIRRLSLANCAPPPPPLHRYGALAELVLRDMPASTPAATYQRLFAARSSPLETLRLVSCGCAGKARRLVISAPCSRLRELVVDGCGFLVVHLHALPALERLACLGNSVELRLASVPRLAHVNLSFSGKSAWGHDELGCFLGDATNAGSLAVRFTGANRWIVPRPLETKLSGLRRLLVAEVPSSWDVTWPRLILVAAPALEVLHIHVANRHPAAAPPGREISWQGQPRTFRHRRLKELVLAGFERTWRQIFFVRFLARVCKSLERVALLKDWCVREKGLWDWELVQQQECPWSEEEKMVVSKQVKYGKYWCRPQLQVVVD
ncbi:unnamed protein product [Urochloa humidicola]